MSIPPKTPAPDTTARSAGTARFWDWCTVCVALAVLAMHLRFAALDTRLPRDLGLYHQDIIVAADAWESLDVAGLVGVLATSTGWLNALHGLLQAVAGPSAPLLNATCAFWVTIVVLGTAWTARTAAGPLAGCVAAALVGAMPMVSVTGRELWIHLPEAALVSTIAAFWTMDPHLERRRTVLWVGVLGALLVSLRASGIPWALGLLLVMGTPQKGHAGAARWLRLALAVLPWLVAVMVQVEDFAAYITAKLNAREGYAQRLKDPLGQWLEFVGLLPALLALVGAMLSVVGARRRVGRLHLLGAGFVLGSVALWAISRAGLDNFVVLAPGLALLAALGLSGDRWVGGVLALEVFLITWLPQLLPVEVVRPLAHLPPYGLYGAWPQYGNRYRPWTGTEAADTDSLLAAVCPASGPCTIAVNQGLYTPFGEEPGRLEVFLSGHDRVELLDLRQGWPPHGRHHDGRAPDALVSWSCRNRDDDWQIRFPRAEAGQQWVTERYNLAPIWESRVDRRCRTVWSTPNAAVAHPERLPTAAVDASRGVAW
ncbi:MAG TPA: hypothetical protein DFR83_22160 [Deltaproteobacteria bacterium]|nr:hypothetical protein [Deltaproteobacteria bacterium]